MTHFEQLGEALLGKAAPAVPAPPPTPRGGEAPPSQADRMYGSIESKVGVYGPAIQEEVAALGDARDFSAEQRTAAVQELATLFGELEVPAAEAGLLAGEIRRGLEADDATAEAARRAMLAEARRRWGEEELDRRIAKADAYLKAHPRLEATLRAAGVPARWTRLLLEKADTLPARKR